ncbi:MAG: lactate utilization protein [Endomicrobiales bacterium]|nr:lactate utilization protein [Endomicrobiales bacterium]
MDENIAWHRQVTLDKLAEKLTNNRFNATIARDAADAAKKILELIQPSESVALGGSQTVKTLKIAEALDDRKQKVIRPLPGAKFDDTLRTRREALLADVYIASPNAVTMDGSLVFVDKIGNRAAGMMFGPKKVIAVAGFNKVVNGENDARERVKNTAGPLNAKRLKLKTPCAASGACSDCDSEQRICNIYVTLKKRPSYTEYHVILLPEDLGY